MMPTTTEPRRIASHPTHADVLRVVKADVPGARRGVPKLLIVGLALAFLGMATGGALLARRLLRPKPIASRYETAKIAVGEVRGEVRATGTLRGLNTVDVGAEVTGRVVSVHADFNDTVKKGQLLAVIDRTQPEAAVEESRAQVKAAEAQSRVAMVTADETAKQLTRTQRLAAEGLASHQDVEVAFAAANRARAAREGALANASVSRASLKAAESRLEKTQVLSPVDGIVLSRLVEPGQTIVAGLASPLLFRVTEDLARMTLTVGVDEADIARVREGQSASFTVHAYPGRSFPARVVGVRNEPSLSRNVVTYEAFLAVDNAEKLFRPGMTGSATIVTDTHAGALLVPNAALRYAPTDPVASKHAPIAEAAGTRIFVLEGNALKPLRVDVGLTDGKVSEINGPGLVPGREVVVDDADPE